MNFFASLRASLKTKETVTILGVLLAIARRRTVTKWIRTALLSEKYRKVFYHIPYFGRKSIPIFDALGEIILEMLFATIDNSTKIQFVIDDTTTKRYGILIEGAGHHHYPTPGKTDTKLCYGHSWVVAAIVVTHHEWGTADCKKEDKNDYCNKQDNTGKIGQVGVD